MEQLTIGQLAAAVTFIVALVTGIKYLNKTIKEWINSALNDRFKTLEKKIDDQDKKLDELDIDECKNYIILFISKVNNGDKIEDMELQRFYNLYEHYLDEGENSFIKTKVEELKAKKFL